MIRSQAAPRAPRRALVFAGGGLKVAYQAGALQVLLDEAGFARWEVRRMRNPQERHCIVGWER